MHTHWTPAMNKALCLFRKTEINLDPANMDEPVKLVLMRQGLHLLVFAEMSIREFFHFSPTSPTSTAPSGSFPLANNHTSILKQIRKRTNQHIPVNPLPLMPVSTYFLCFPEQTSWKGLRTHSQSSMPLLPSFYRNCSRVWSVFDVSISLHSRDTLLGLLTPCWWLLISSACWPLCPDQLIVSVRSSSLYIRSCGPLH